MDSATSQRLSEIKDDLDKMILETNRIKKMLVAIDMPTLQLPEAVPDKPKDTKKNALICPSCNRSAYGINHRLCIIKDFRNIRHRWQEAVHSSAQLAEKN